MQEVFYYYYVLLIIACTHTCYEIYPWNSNSAIFLYQISPKSVHFSSYSFLLTGIISIQHIINESILSIFEMNKEWAPLLWQQNFLLVLFNFYVLEEETSKTVLTFQSVKWLLTVKVKFQKFGLFAQPPF